jgi:hypothetical protein
LDGVVNNLMGASGPANLNKIFNALTNNTGMFVYANESAPTLTTNVSGMHFFFLLFFFPLS